jgi:hypothetical protein
MSTACCLWQRCCPVPLQNFQPEMTWHPTPALLLWLLPLLQYLGDFVGEEQLEEFFGSVVQSLGLLSSGGLQ